KQVHREPVLGFADPATSAALPLFAVIIGNLAVPELASRSTQGREAAVDVARHKAEPATRRRMPRCGRRSGRPGYGSGLPG
ncbi:MAG: hypothetical protein ACRD1G_02540, partial [Acidimicrobiales bacterium]